MFFGTILAMIGISLMWILASIRNGEWLHFLGIFVVFESIGAFLLWAFRDFDKLGKPSVLTYIFFAMGHVIASVEIYMSIQRQLNGRFHHISPILTIIESAIFLGGIPPVVLFCGSLIEGIIMFNRSFSRPS